MCRKGTRNYHKALFSHMKTERDRAYIRDFLVLNVLYVVVRETWESLKCAAFCFFSPSFPLSSEGAFLQQGPTELHGAADEDFSVRNPRREGGHSLRLVSTINSKNVQQLPRENRKNIHVEMLDKDKNTWSAAVFRLPWPWGQLSWQLLLFSPHRPVLKGNTTMSFLITTDVDIGDLMIVKLRWEKDTIISWSDWWGSSKFHIRKLRIKSGETQSK